MKCIFYISKANSGGNSSLPIGLSKIFLESKKNNVTNNICGVLSYKKGYYIQIIEGDDEQIDDLLFMLRNDARHDNITILLEKRISRSMFSKWPLKLVASLEELPEFKVFLGRYSYELGQHDKRTQALMHKLFAKKTTDSQVFDPAKKTNQLYSVSSWPPFASINPSASLLELCALLQKQPLTYNEMIRQGLFDSEHKLQHALTFFNDQKVLKIEPVQRHFSAQEPQQEPVFGSLFKKVRSFLSF